MAKSGLSGLPPHRPVETALTYLPGVSRSRAKALLDRARIDPDTTTDDLSDSQVDLLRQLLRAELRDESGEIPADADNNRPWLHGAGVEFAPYLDRVRAMVQRYLVVLRPWDRSTEDPTKNPLPAGTLQTLDATCLRCLRGEALDAERTAFVGRMDARLIERYDDIAPSGEGGQRFDEMRVIFGLNDLECDLLGCCWRRSWCQNSFGCIGLCGATRRVASGRRISCSTASIRLLCAARRFWQRWRQMRRCAVTAWC